MIYPSIQPVYRPGAAGPRPRGGSHCAPPPPLRSPSRVPAPRRRGRAARARGRGAGAWRAPGASPRGRGGGPPAPATPARRRPRRWVGLCDPARPCLHARGREAPRRRWRPLSRRRRAPGWGAEGEAQGWACFGVALLEEPGAADAAGARVSVGRACVGKGRD